ncbi:MAG: threonine synthase [Deltaproteobacteria bacterium]|nr:threonine synthase [Deltaproteobacteria bacterium]
MAVFSFENALDAFSLVIEAAIGAFMAYLQRFDGEGPRHSIFKPLFSCPETGALLDVFHDVEQMKEVNATAWKVILRSRGGSARVTDRSGVWAHREWVMPDLDEKDMISLGEGRGPLVELPRLQRQLKLKGLFVKQCGQGATGSFKDLGMSVLVSCAKAMKNRDEDVRALICASTGDTSAALAAYGARAGIPVVVLLPAGKVSMAQLVQPIAHGAKVIAMDGDFDACMKVVQELAWAPGMFLGNSKNPLRLEGQKTVAFEIAQDLNWQLPELVAVPSGNLGNIAALYKGFSLLVELGLTQSIPRLVACQVDAANPLFRSFENGLKTLSPMTAQDTHASAIRIGNPVSWPRAQIALQESNGLVTSCSEQALLDIAARADREGLFVCPHTAAALAGVEGLVAQGVISENDTVVVVSTANGLKFADQKARFHDDNPVFAGMDYKAELGHWQNPPEQADANTSAVRAVLDSWLKDAEARFAEADDEQMPSTVESQDEGTSS